MVDGDTIWLEGLKIRIADIDTPEITSPKCNAEYEREFVLAIGLWCCSTEASSSCARSETATRTNTDASFAS